MSPLSLRAPSRGARRRSVLAPLLIAAPLALAALPSAAQAELRTARIAFSQGCGGTGNVTANQWTVPAGVTRTTLVVQGQPGEGATDSYGRGAQITTLIDVTPGQTLYFCFGIGGGNAASGASGQAGRGGGYTSVSRDPNNSNRLVVAAGGGGSGSGPGAGHGGDAGTANSDAAGGASSGAAGGGGKPDENRAGIGGVNSANASANGGAGTVYIGGPGGAFSGGNGGGGGGGGIYGGGGGAGSTSSGAGAAGGAGGYSQCLVGGCSSDLANVTPYVSFSWDEPIATSTTLSFVDTTRAISGKPVTLRASVTPTPTTGTVDFTVDGGSMWNCQSVPVDANGAAECRTNVPGERGMHAVRAVYADTSGAYAGSSHEVPFQVYGGIPSVSPSPSAEFGEVELGKSTTRQLTVTNVGDADLTLSETYGFYIAEYRPRARPPRSTEFTAVDDQCSGRVIAPGASCAVTVKFAPSALGARSAEIEIGSDSWYGPDEDVVLRGTGIAARPEPEPQPEQPREPETPRQPETPSAPQTPAAPAPTPSPVKPLEPPRPPVNSPAVGASSPLTPAHPRACSRTAASDFRSSARRVWRAACRAR